MFRTVFLIGPLHNSGKELGTSLRGTKQSVSSSFRWIASFLAMTKINYARGYWLLFYSTKLLWLQAFEKEVNHYSGVIQITGLVNAL